MSVPIIGMTGLVEITLPDVTLRFCDGGFFVYESQTYRSEDAVFGTISALQTMGEGVGDTVPALSMTLLPPDSTAPSEICQPGNQTSRARFIIAEYDAETGLITTADVFFDGQLDQTVYSFGENTKELGMSIVSLAERFFEGNIGNTMNSVFHKSIFPGETGHDNANGLSVPVAWGVEAPPSNMRRSGGGGYGGGAGDGGGRGYDVGQQVF